MLKRIAATLFIGIIGISAAQAMPVAPIATTQAEKPVLIDYACGRGFHLTPWGQCRPDWRRPPPPPRYVYRDYRRGWDQPPPRRYVYRDHDRRGWDRPPPPRFYGRRDGWDGPRW